MDENSKGRAASEPGAPVIVYATFPTAEVAGDIAVELVEAGLAACTNILPGVLSVYRWDGKTEKGSEVAAIIKTTADRADAVIGAIAGLHPYAVPAIVVVPLMGGLDRYLSWIVEATDGNKGAR